MATVENQAAYEAPAGLSEYEPEAPLRAYLQAKQSVAQVLRDAQEFVDRVAPWASERVHDLMARLGEDQFRLVVVGQFKRGKSSLMNAIIGRPLLPTGVLPVTSAITSLRYGSRLCATVKRAGHAIDQHVPFVELPAFITERGNPNNEKRVLSAEIEVPAAFLRRGLHFVDTPGIGSAHEHNTARTLSFLPEADAAIVVTAADGPMSDVELQFLDAIRQHTRKLFFVLNKIDLVGTRERDEILAYTADVVAKRLAIDSVRVFPVSATKALAADPTDREALAASGLVAFQTALATFLNDERRVVFLIAVLDRAITMLEEIRSAQSAPAAVSPVDVADEFGSLVARTAALRDALFKGEPLPTGLPAPASPARVGSVADKARARVAPIGDGRDLVTRTCAICAPASDAVFDFLCHYQYAITNDAATQRGLLASRGLCPTHTWHLERLSSPRGVSLGYPPLLDQFEERLGATTHLTAAAAATRVQDLACHADSCPVCLARDRAEQRAAEQLAKALQAPEGRMRFEQWQWLCLPHLRLLLTGVPDDVAAMLLRGQVRRLGQLSESMREYVIKYDARRHSLMSEEEARAYRRALVLLVGERYLFRTDAEG